MRRDASGDHERAVLIAAYLPLAERLARRFAAGGERRDDLSQVAALAVVRAVDRRDPERAGALPAYVARCVDGELRRHLRDHAATVRVPRSLDPSERSAPAAATARRPVRLEEDVAADTPSLAEVGLDRALVARAVRALDRRERHVVLLRFFADRTQAEIADELQLSQPHVSRLLQGALAKMRRRLGESRALSRAS